MNGASDLNLALAVHDAGATPSLMIPWAQDKNHALVADTLKEFKASTGACDVVFQISIQDLQDIQMMKLLTEYKVSHVEIFGNFYAKSGDPGFVNFLSKPETKAALKLLRKNTKVIERIFAPTPAIDHFDAFALKGSDSAGMAGSITVQDLFDQQRAMTPDYNVIPYGGIGTPAQVAHYIGQGAAGVAVGTLFAASKESCLSDSAKRSLISATKSDIISLSDTRQNALVLGDTGSATGTDPNRQHKLELGIHGTGDQGLIYASTAVEYITEILPVKDIVDYLVSDIKILYQ